LAALTLSTFRTVPWNALSYERIGFRPLDEPELTPGLRELRRQEAADGLDPRARVCMRLGLTERGLVRLSDAGPCEGGSYETESTS
jgi:hypothetical protein